MKKIHRIIALILAAALLGGCGAGGNTQETSSTETEDTEMANYSLSNPNATETTKKVYEYICSLGGVNTLSAQQESTWMGSVDYEMDYLLDATGKLPAMRGLDYMHDDFTGVNERAVKWWKEGGLVTICWHTGADFSGEWKHALETSVADWDAVFTEGSHENTEFLKGMDKAAEALLELQEAGVTVLWRPFHELDGKWFWWGKDGSETFVKLWRMMYDRYTNHWGLNNLIWVLGYSHVGVDYSSWYPGDEYVDIIGADSYEGGVQRKLYEKLTAVTQSKPFAFHECGTNPTEDQLKTTPWAWFMTWHTNYVTEENTKEALKELYNSKYVITRDELPSFLN